jgi:hypothetical protein
MVCADRSSGESVFTTHRADQAGRLKPLALHKSSVIGRKCLAPLTFPARII